MRLEERLPLQAVVVQPARRAAPEQDWRRAEQVVVQRAVWRVVQDPAQQAVHALAALAALAAEAAERQAVQVGRLQLQGEAVEHTQPKQLAVAVGAEVERLVQVAVGQAAWVACPPATSLV